MKALYKMEVDCGRQGSLKGIFIADDKDVEILVKHKLEVHFGEVLGKHSDVCGAIDEDEIIKITDEENVIEIFEKHHLDSGYDPFGYPLSWHDAEEYFPDDPDDRIVQEAVELLKEKEV